MQGFSRLLAHVAGRPFRKRRHARRRWKAREERKGARQRRRITRVASRVAQRQMARCRTRADPRQRPARLPSPFGTRTGRHAYCQSTNCARPDGQTCGLSAMQTTRQITRQTVMQVRSFMARPARHQPIGRTSRSQVRRSTCPTCKQSTCWVCSRSTLSRKRVAVVYAAARHANAGFDWER